MACPGSEIAVWLIALPELRSRPCIAGRSSARGWKPTRSAQFKQLQEENARLKRLVAELTLDKTMLQDALAKKL